METLVFIVAAISTSRVFAPIWGFSLRHQIACVIHFALPYYCGFKFEDVRKHVLFAFKYIYLRVRLPSCLKLFNFHPFFMDV
jgi:hypothetical protein